MQIFCGNASLYVLFSGFFEEQSSKEHHLFETNLLTLLVHLYSNNFLHLNSSVYLIYFTCNT